MADKLKQLAEELNHQWVTEALATNFGIPDGMLPEPVMRAVLKKLQGLNPHYITHSVTSVVSKEMLEALFVKHDTPSDHAELIRSWSCCTDNIGMLDAVNKSRVQMADWFALTARHTYIMKSDSFASIIDDSIDRSIWLLAMINVADIIHAIGVGLAMQVINEDPAKWDALVEAERAAKLN